MWSSGCQSWYQEDGYNATIWPHFTFQYWWQTRRVALSDYELVGQTEEVREPFAVAPAPAR